MLSFLQIKYKSLPDFFFKSLAPNTLPGIKYEFNKFKKQSKMEGTQNLDTG